MKSFISIFLLSYFSLAAFVPRMDFDRLYQLPNLAAHLLEHRESDSDLDFVEFIYSHYGQDSQEPADGHELPFQKHDCCISCHTFASFFPADKITSESPLTSLQDIYTFHFTSQHISEIWQPPRA